MQFIDVFLTPFLLDDSLFAVYYLYDKICNINQKIKKSGTTKDVIVFRNSNIKHSKGAFRLININIIFLLLSYVFHTIYKNEIFKKNDLYILFYNYFSTYIPFIISIYVTTYILKYIKKNTDVIEKVEVTLDVYKIVIMVYMFHYCVNTGSSSISEIAQSLGYCTGFIYFYNEIKYQRYYQKSYIHGCENYFSSAYINEKV